MLSRNITHIDVLAKEWFDRVNGNSYFSAQITVTTKNKSHDIYVPFQYGYGSHYESVALDAIRKELNCLKSKNVHGLNRASKMYNFKLNMNIVEGCKQKDVRQWGQK